MSSSNANLSLAEQLMAVMRAGWAADAKQSVEHFLTQHPQLADDEEGLLDLIYTEYCLRRDSGEEASTAEYAMRFPHHIDRLRPLFELHAAIDSPQPAAANAGGSEANRVSDVRVATTDDLAPNQLNKLPRAGNRDASSSGSGRLQVRCPGCHLELEIAVDTALTDLTCDSCGSHFSLVNQSEATRMAPSLVKVGRFELIERLGVGGFGSVWKARDKELARTVAIKIPRQAGLTADDQEKFFREARAAAQLRHPNIVSVHEVGRSEDVIFIVSDFVRGVTLTDWLAGAVPPFRETTQLIATIARALQHAHEKGVIHRDLKPANIMMDEGHQPHVMDFGLAKRNFGEVTMTVEGQILGTPAYMSPEQAGGEAHWTDCRSDIYSLGVILFRMLTGELPFRGSAQMQIHQRLAEEAPSPRKLNSHIPLDLATICLKCLEREPNRRYDSATALASELDRFLKGEPIHARPLSMVGRAMRWAQRKPAAALAACSVLLLAIGGPAAAVKIDSSHKQQKMLTDQKNKLLKQYQAESQITTAQLGELQKQLELWQGQAEPSQVWPVTPASTPRQALARRLLDAVQRRTTTPSVEARDDLSAQARSALGLALLADCCGEAPTALANFQQAQKLLQKLCADFPRRLELRRSLAECQAQIARLAEGTDRPRAAEAYEASRESYQELAALEPSNTQAQLEWLEAELRAGILAGHAAGLERITQADKIADRLEELSAAHPEQLYDLACLLVGKEPWLVPLSTTERSGATATAPSPVLAPQSSINPETP